MDERQPGQNVPIFRLIFEMVLVGVAAFFFAIIISGLLYLVLGGPEAQSQGAAPAELQELREIATFFAAPLVIFAVLVFGDALLRRRHVSLRALGFKRPESIGLTIFQGLSLTVLLLGLWVVAWQVYEAQGLAVPFEIVDVYSGDQFRFFYAMTAVAWIGSGLGEEVLFRGFFLNNFLTLFRGHKIGVYLAVIFQAMLFSLMHMAGAFEELGGSLVQMLPVFVTGLIMGWAYFLFHRNLWPLVIAHGILNNVYFSLIYTKIIG